MITIRKYKKIFSEQESIQDKIILLWLLFDELIGDGLSFDNLGDYIGDISETLLSSIIKDSWSEEEKVNVTYYINLYIRDIAEKTLTSQGTGF